MSVKGSDPNSLSQAMADLEAVDARLSTLAASHTPADSDNADLATPIQESRKLVRAAINVLAAAQALDQAAGGAKRRVKIKAASETTTPVTPVRAEAASRSGPPAAKSSSKASARGRSANAAASTATAATANAPASSLLARLGAALPGPSLPQHAATSAGDQPTPVDLRDTSDRLARLEAEIASLTETSAPPDTHSTAVATAEAAPPTPAQATEARTPAAGRGAVHPTPVAQPRPGIGDPVADDGDDDAELVIVRPGAVATGSTADLPPPTRQSPRVFRDPPPTATDDDDAEVEIVRPSARPHGEGRETRAKLISESDRAAASASKPAAPTKWRLFRGSR